jgi:CheY-like chemotaxis protein
MRLAGIGPGRGSQADATPAQFDRLRAAGAAGYLTKPIDVESLLNTVQSSTPAHATR